MTSLGQCVLLTLLICWLLALLGVEPLAAFCEAHAIPATLEEVGQRARSGYTGALAYADARPVIGLVILPTLALTALVWR